MKSNKFSFVFCLSAYFPKAITDSETVWLKDITTWLQTDKRTLSDPDLPDQLSFLLKRKSHTMTLNLKRNYDIDPNADIYTVRKLSDGQSLLERTDNVEDEDVAYYQDRDNGAFMTVRCMKRSNRQCDRLINGNIRIGDKNYDLLPSKNDVTSRNVLEITDLLGKQYLLQDQSIIKGDISFLQELSNIQRDTPVQQEQFNIEGDQSFLQDQTRIESDNTVERQVLFKKEYFVKVLVLLDSSIWNWFFWLLDCPMDLARIIPMARKNIRRYFSHIMNGVNRLYNGINDPDMRINVKISSFVLFETEADFPHNTSRFHMVNGIKMIDATPYLLDLAKMESTNPFVRHPEYDVALLFTQPTSGILAHRYLRLGWRVEFVLDKVFELEVAIEFHRTDSTTVDMLKGYTGVSFTRQVCVPGSRVLVVRKTDYFNTMITAAHELAHSLGAEHDGEGNATACKSEDRFIMTNYLAAFNETNPYSKNNYLFSNCSVMAFKKTLPNKVCVSRIPHYRQEVLDEWNEFISRLPGQYYTPSQQCKLIIGKGSRYCGVLTESICMLMYCWSPVLHRCIDVPFRAASGTPCGTNMWCQQGVCVQTSQN